MNNENCYEVKKDGKVRDDGNKVKEWFLIRI